MAVAKKGAKAAPTVTLSIGGGTEHDVSAIFNKGEQSTGEVEVPKLKSYIERIERLEEDKAGIGSDIKDVYAEAKSNGFDTKAMRSIVSLRKLTTNERTEREYMLDLYKKALGMQPSFDFEGGE